MQSHQRTIQAVLIILFNLVFATLYIIIAWAIWTTPIGSCYTDSSANSYKGNNMIPYFKSEKIDNVLDQISTHDQTTHFLDG